MKSKKIYLIRHGQTDFNLKGIVQGSGVDSSLNQLGRRQASLFYQTYCNEGFEKVYTSCLKRSIESVQSFIDDGIPHQPLASLNEICWGTREGMDITPEEDRYYHNTLQAWQNGETSLRIEGGDSPEDVYHRQTAGLSSILAGNEEKILICMHGRAMRILLCQMLNYPLTCMDTFEHSNLCLYQLNYGGGLFSVVKFNEIRHLDSQ